MIRFGRNMLAVLAVALTVTVAAPRAHAQWLEPTRLYVGMSGGFGGLHCWGKPTFDLIYGRWTARLAPGLRYLGGGVTYHLAHFNPKVRHDRILILSLYYNNDWFLAHSKAYEFKRDQHLWMLMPGIHVNLDHRGTIFMEVSAGLMYQHERIFNPDKSIRSSGDHFLPMGEVRIGGVFLSRKEHVQQFPHNYTKPKHDKVKSKKLKFK